MEHFRKLLGGKIHRATVTDANLDYEGSITIDRDLIDAAGFMPYESVHVWNITNGERFETYVIEGQRGSGEICINGAGAHLAKTGHMIIVANFIEIPLEQAGLHKPRIVLVDQNNSVVDR